MTVWDWSKGNENVLDWKIFTGFYEISRFCGILETCSFLCGKSENQATSEVERQSHSLLLFLGRGGGRIDAHMVIYTDRD